MYLKPAAATNLLAVDHNRGPAIFSPCRPTTPAAFKCSAQCRRRQSWRKAAACCSGLTHAARGPRPTLGTLRALGRGSVTGPRPKMPPCCSRDGKPNATARIRPHGPGPARPIPCSRRWAGGASSGRTRRARVTARLAGGPPSPGETKAARRSHLRTLRTSKTQAVHPGSPLGSTCNRSRRREPQASRKA